MPVLRAVGVERGDPADVLAAHDVHLPDVLCPLRSEQALEILLGFEAECFRVLPSDGDDALNHRSGIGGELPAGLLEIGYAPLVEERAVGSGFRNGTRSIRDVAEAFLRLVPDPVVLGRFQVDALSRGDVLQDMVEGRPML